MEKYKDSIEIEFEVEKEIDYRLNSGFVIMNVKILSHPGNMEIPTTEHKVKGVINKRPVIGDVFIAKGKWEIDSRYGYQFVANAIILKMPETNKGIIHFLKNQINGIGEAKANRVVEKYGESTLRIIKEQPERLIEVQGFGKKQIESIKRELLIISHYKEIVDNLEPMGFRFIEMSKLYDKFGFATVNMVQENPYIVREHRITEFETCDDVATIKLFSPNHVYRVRQGLLEVLWRLLKNGDVYIEKQEFYKETEKFLNENGVMEKIKLNYYTDFIPALDYLLNNDKLKVEKNLKDGKDNIYIKFYLDMENHIVRMVKAMVNQNIQLMTGIEFEEYFKDVEKDNFKIGNKQKEAIKMALTNKISILTGGGGTGKTHILDLLIQIIKSKNDNADIKLAAPTGRASAKLSKETGLKATTIHRLLGLKSRDNITEHQEIPNKLDVDFLIIDEASMIDIYMFFKLLSAVSEKTQILIVGDYQQLPSVGPGLVLRDLISSERIAVTNLTKIYRQKRDSQIIINAKNITDGNTEIVEDRENRDDFYFFQNNMRDDIKRMTLDSIEALIKKGFKLSDVQVLTFVNDGDLGSKQLNSNIQQIYNPKASNKNEINTNDGKIFRVNDRVMQTENNYDLNVFNGETGYIKSIKLFNSNNRYSEVVVDFEGEKIIYAGEMLNELELAYAITVHKAQGNGFPAVVIPIHAKESHMVNKSMLYTSVTRAEDTIIIIGDKSVYFEGMRNTKNMIRNSNIKEKLIRDIEPFISNEFIRKETMGEKIDRIKSIL